MAKRQNYIHLHTYVVIEMCKIPKVKDIATFEISLRISVSCFRNQRTTEIAIHDTFVMIH